MFIKGGLFEHEFHGQELAFKYAVRKINRRSDLLPNTQLVYDIQQTPVQDSFLAAKRGMCTMTSDQSQKAVSAYFTSKQILSFGFAEQSSNVL